MTTVDDFDAITEGFAPAPAPDGTLLDRLRAQRATRQETHLDIVVPDWGADTGGVQIIARMRRVPWKGKAAQALNRMQRAAASQGGSLSADQELAAECDLLIVGLDQLYARDGDGEPVPLDPDTPMRFDQRTSDALGLDATRAREVVMALFGGDVGEFALKAAAARYMTWLQQLEVVTADEGKG